MFSVLVIRLGSLRLLRVSRIVMRLRMFLLLIAFLKASHSFRNRRLVICKNAYLFFSSRRRHTSFACDWSSDVCSSDPPARPIAPSPTPAATSARSRWWSEDRAVTRASRLGALRRAPQHDGLEAAWTAPQFTATKSLTGWGRRETGRRQERPGVSCAEGWGAPRVRRGLARIDLGPVRRARWRSRAAPATRRRSPWTP